jgi:hypothetical protein
MKIDPRRCSMLPVFAFRGVRHQMHEDAKPGLSPAERHKILGKLLDAICERERRKALYQRLPARAGKVCGPPTYPTE